MAYTLGFIFADGAIIDARSSSRTCYITICCNDKDLLEQIKKFMNSNHPLQKREPRITPFNNKPYFCKESYRIRIGSKIMYYDLIERGVIPNKSLTMRLPEIPIEYFSFFLRGYFEGDGCLSLYFPKDKMIPRIRIIFTSGSYAYLNQLVKSLSNILNTTKGAIFTKNKSNWLRFSKYDSLKILNYMYKDLYLAPFLERKYKKYLSII